ncbi:MAG: YdcF family protein [Clostridiaceae bacterium]|nr:YdcF family protein [Clostridiaceae bacterium]
MINLLVMSKAKKYIISKDSKVPKAQALIILGAFVSPQGQVSDILKDRLDTALEILKNNKELKIIVTGDHGNTNYDEVNTMRIYLENKGIDPERIYMDHAGFSTYDSIYRAKAIFDVKSAIIVTQAYHLDRAIYLARQKGIETYGVAADKHKYRAIIKYEARERLAIFKDFFYANVLKPKPKFLGDKIPIMSSDSSLTRDKH